MNHGKKFNHLSRKSEHRKAMLSNLSCSLIIHKRIQTTLAKAKALRKYIEPILTKAKNDTMHSRRVVYSYLQNKLVINELFNSIGERITDRPGGYIRIIRLGFRKGDNAEICMIELVDYNELLLNIKKETKSQVKRKRTRRKKSKSSAVESGEKTTNLENQQESET